MTNEMEFELRYAWRALCTVLESPRMTKMRYFFHAVLHALCNIQDGYVVNPSVHGWIAATGVIYWRGYLIFNPQLASAHITTPMIAGITGIDVAFRILTGHDIIPFSTVINDASGVLALFATMTHVELPRVDCPWLVAHDWQPRSTSKYRLFTLLHTVDPREPMAALLLDIRIERWARARTPSARVIIGHVGRSNTKYIRRRQQAGLVRTRSGMEVDLRRLSKNSGIPVAQLRLVFERSVGFHVLSDGAPHVVQGAHVPRT